jgi:hypothetical protein
VKRFTVVLWVVLGWVGVQSIAGGESRFVRLRTETIATPDPVASRGVGLQGSAGPVSGLYLVQFRGRIEPAWREDLAARGVELLHYIPDDAFLVHARAVELADLRGLASVRWVGAYEARHKLDPRLSQESGSSVAEGRLAVKLLAGSHANAIELAGLARRLRPLTYRHRSALGTVLAGEVRVTDLAALLQSPLVLWIEPRSRMRLLDEVSAQIVGGDSGGPGAGTEVQALGYDGRGVIVAVADSGLDTGEFDTMHPDLAGRVDAFFAYGGLPDASDEHSHGTHVAGIVAGNAATGEVDDSGYLYGLGVAPGAHLVAQRIFDGVGNYYPPESYDQLTHDAVRNGAVLGSNSWGNDTQGVYDLDAAEFDALVRDADGTTPGEQPYILEFSAGNSGPGRQTIGSPAVGKNVIATGACQNNRFEFPIYADGPDATADFSSRGPCADGRIKPDIMAPGTWIASVKSQYATDENAWAPIDEYYLYQGGTSQAGPHASGAAAVLVQYYRQTHANATPSPALVKAGLINSATDMGVSFVPDFEGELIQVGDTGPVPNFDEGWGRVDLVNLVGDVRRYGYTEQGAGLSTGRVFEKRVVASPNDAFKVTLAYTDAPGLPAASLALVNDLDLEVVAPDGRLFRGNAFLDGESVAGTPDGDRLNNVEAVHIAQPLPGEYLVRVRAVNVVTDVHRRVGAVPEQDFALVVSGDLPAPGEGIVFFDREFYRVPGPAVVRLIDAQLAGQAGVVVQVHSTADPVGEALTLRPAAGGAFTNAVTLVTSGPGTATDGRLLVAHESQLEVEYQDVSPPVRVTGEAVVDLMPPLIEGVYATNKFGRTTVVWLTDEPANATVVYRLPGGATQSVTNAGYAQGHRVELPPLQAGQTYLYAVVSADRAGNIQTNNNQGQWFSFVAREAAVALLVYSPEASWDELYGSFFGMFPGMEEWTGPLDALGLDYEIWNTVERQRGPTAAELLPFRLVLWRPEEFGAVPDGFQSALSAYLAAGRSLFAASFDLLSRLDLPSDSAFRSNVLHVTSFVEDGGAWSIAGQTGDPIADGLSFDLDYFLFPDASLIGIDWPQGNDHLRLAADAAPLFSQEEGRTVGLRYPRTGLDSPSRVVFLSFPLEAVPLDIPGPGNRLDLLGRVVEFLVPGLRGGTSLTFDRAAYGLPGAATLELTDMDRAGAGHATVSVVSTTEPAPRSVSLSETVRLGVFRGLVKLGAAADPPAAGVLRVRNGDSVRAVYVTGAAREIEASAVVDTVPPGITGVATEPAYNEAMVSWETDKPADSLVQFDIEGSAFPVNRTAYDAGLNASHAIQLAGLLPDREYVYRVTSRDAAGNTATDDNQGRLYRFHTLKPITPPWTDTLEGGRAGWAVYNDEAYDDETGQSLLDSGWQYGQPANPEGIGAHSGVKCWATNLKGQEVSLAISQLVSPAVDLTGGNRATFRFWQYYDFTERSELLDLEVGQVAISTDNGATWTAVYVLADIFSIGWEPVEVDVSAYAGHVVRFLWDYQMFSFEPYPRPGWFIDDVSVVVSTTPLGRLSVTNNLAQARFGVSGPNGAAYVGGGTFWRLTNAPAGTYTIQWSPVDFYQTPAAQTLVLTTNLPLTATGTYTFPDTNRNDISDLFEQRYFRAVDPVHSPAIDTDHDGMSDLGEFLAGTDPTQSSSRFEVLSANVLPNRTVRVEWRSVPGHTYRLELSTDLVRWLPASEWLSASGQLAAASLPPLSDSNTYLFRVVSRP